ncbi:hypothetical protein [Actinomadura sediminis]|uniref:DUF59 domain-containing protein n=1 Tax=Actinomadura sediminis TaxID=1038904 RepID=A0ABW3EI96_9ACTN
MTTNDVPQEDVERARDVVARVLARVPRPVLFAKVTLSVLSDPAVPRPCLVTVRVDLNGRPVNAYAAGLTMADAIGLAGSRLRARVEHMDRYWGTHDKGRRRTVTGGEGPRR